MTMAKSNTCKTCAYWVLEANSPSIWETGTCHYWPPARTKQVSSVTTEQVENPAISDLNLRLSTAKSLQIKLESESKRVFTGYPVKFTYEELQAARLDVETGLSNIAFLKAQIDQEKSSNPFVLKEIHHVHESGDWPVTAGGEWCGQWNSTASINCQ